MYLVAFFAAYFSQSKNLYIHSKEKKRKEVGSCKTNSTQPHFTSVLRQSLTSIELFSKRDYKLGVTFMSGKENLCNDDECTCIYQHVNGYV